MGLRIFTPPLNTPVGTSAVWQKLASICNPYALTDKVGVRARQHRRLAKLRKTVAADLHLGQIDSLELLELCRAAAPTVIYDIGANRGTWTLLTKAVYPASQVHAFEPLETHRAGFERRMRGIAGVMVHQVA